ncbi:metal ABC transporter solute-binding protein, Zn/Mn family [Aestuariivirga sp. YIM B02566]|uniref:Zinc ABC transporter substrate-binding protein n=1 Tax=Taklimakanibacter albus TaxID=2800327 RepID=A0ACC5QYY3_9HYPH|nr:zinc ABC transporter substrate-binding protein [Aestuariivirga sp. YIM B02566]MBK1865601.1 zinc ABC transporter substrate-binding protein [Aestuariivirga sp. YIM B02566]
MKYVVSLLFLSLTAASPAVAAGPIKIVAAENFYGDVARQIGGDAVEVVSILNNPDQDPHLFEASPSVARAISDARIVIANGVDYDPWIGTLLSASPSSARKLIVVGDLAGKKTGDNPHLWYDPRNVLAMARQLSSVLAEEDAANISVYARRLADFEASLQPVSDRIAEVRGHYAGTPVAATEPVFGYMFDALGLEVKETSFQNSVMNDTEPSASDVAAFENDLKTHKIKLLVYNSQATDPAAERLKSLAEQAGIPVVGATETQPDGKSYQSWMMSGVAEVGKAFGMPTQ